MMSQLNNDIDYEVIRSNRTTVDIVIERDGRVLVRVPKSIPFQQIEEIVKARSSWIYRTLAKWRELNSSRYLREFRNGESFLYLGRSYSLRLVSDQQQPLLLKNGRFCLRCDILEEGGISATQAAFRDFYTDRAKARITHRVNYYAPKVGVIPKNMNVRELGNRWASCSPKGNLAFHWKCILAPQTIIDYIIVHELCHFHHRDHAEAFWNEVDKVLPSYNERIAWLRKHGASLDV